MNTISKEQLKKANSLFKLYNINTFIKDNKIFINLGDIELEISKEEIKERAKQFENKTTNFSFDDEGNNVVI
tara:strand:+ start:1381 stop:1596 length:216 start_codon:yes stop_codon:yes gene_type:complete